MDGKRTAEDKRSGTAGSSHGKSWTGRFIDSLKRIGSSRKTPRIGYSRRGRGVLHRVENSAGEKYPGTGVRLSRPDKTPSFSSFKLSAEPGRNLDEYQRDALIFILSNYRMGRKGCVLADEYGVNTEAVIARLLEWALNTGKTCAVITDRPKAIQMYMQCRRVYSAKTGYDPRAVNIMSHEESRKLADSKIDLIVIDEAHRLAGNIGAQKAIIRTKYTLAVTPEPYSGPADIHWLCGILELDPIKLARDLGYEKVRAYWIRSEWVDGDEAAVRVTAFLDLLTASGLMLSRMEQRSSDMLTIHRGIFPKEVVDEYIDLEMALEQGVEDAAEISQPSVLNAKIVGMLVARRFLHWAKIEPVVHMVLKAHSSRHRIIICLEAMNVIDNLDMAERSCALTYAERIRDATDMSVSFATSIDEDIEDTVKDFVNDTENNVLVVDMNGDAIDPHMRKAIHKEKLCVIIPTMPADMRQFRRLVAWGKAVAGGGPVEFIIIESGFLADSWNRQIVANYWKRCGGKVNGPYLYTLDDATLNHCRYFSEDEAQALSQNGIVVVPNREYRNFETFSTERTHQQIKSLTDYRMADISGTASDEMIFGFSELRGKTIRDVKKLSPIKLKKLFYSAGMEIP